MLRTLVMATSLVCSGFTFAEVLHDLRAPISLIALTVFWLVGNLYFIGRWAEKEFDL